MPRFAFTSAPGPTAQYPIRSNEAESRRSFFVKHPIVREAAMLVKICLVATLALIALVCPAQRSHAQEFNAEKHYSVSFLACDASGRCERMRRPLDADNDVHCMMKAGMVGVAEWLKERPGWRLSEMHCAANGEAYL
jgi:hypothetical protein